MILGCWRRVKIRNYSQLDRLVTSYKSWEFCTKLGNLAGTVCILYIITLDKKKDLDFNIKTIIVHCPEIKTMFKFRTNKKKRLAQPCIYPDLASFLCFFCQYTVVIVCLQCSPINFEYTCAGWHEEHVPKPVIHFHWQCAKSSNLVHIMVK